MDDLRVFRKISIDGYEGQWLGRVSMSIGREKKRHGEKKCVCSKKEGKEREGQEVREEDILYRGEGL